MVALYVYKKDLSISCRGLRKESEKTGDAMLDWIRTRGTFMQSVLCGGLRAVGA